MIVKCAECECAPTKCKRRESFENLQCASCSKDNACCCVAIHIIKMKIPCCNELTTCSKTDIYDMALNPRNGRIANGDTSKTRMGFGFRSFFPYAKGLYVINIFLILLFCLLSQKSFLTTTEPRSRFVVPLR
jgi:hypothetical protein